MSARAPKNLRFVLAGPPPERCGAQPSPRSTARCERPPRHEECHTGRTRGGYWKSWGEKVAA
jgi:hypothetical protein